MILALNASEIVALIRAQTSNLEEAQDFYVSVWKEYIAEEEFDRSIVTPTAFMMAPIMISSPL